MAEAQREAETARGEGEAVATGIYAKALEQDPEFYAFVRTMDAYKKSVQGETRLILSPESEFSVFSLIVLNSD